MAPKHERTPKKKDALDELADPASVKTDTPGRLTPGGSEKKRPPRKTIYEMIVGPDPLFQNEADTPPGPHPTPGRTMFLWNLFAGARLKEWKELPEVTMKFFMQKETNRRAGICKAKDAMFQQMQLESEVLMRELKSKKRAVKKSAAKVMEDRAAKVMVDLSTIPDDPEIAEILKMLPASRAATPADNLGDEASDDTAGFSVFVQDDVADGKRAARSAKRARTPGRPLIEGADYDESEDDDLVPAQRSSGNLTNARYDPRSPVKPQPFDGGSGHTVAFTRDNLRDGYPCADRLPNGFGNRSVRALAQTIFKLVAFPEQSEMLNYFLQHGHIDLNIIPPLKLRHQMMRTDSDFATHYYEVRQYCSGHLHRLTPGGRKMLSEVIALFCVLHEPMQGVSLRLVHTVASQPLSATMIMDQNWRLADSVSLVTRKLETVVHSMSSAAHPTWPLSLRTGWEYTTRDEYIKATSIVAADFAAQPQVGHVSVEHRLPPRGPRTPHAVERPRSTARPEQPLPLRSTLPLKPHHLLICSPSLLCMRCGRKDGHRESACPHPAHVLLAVVGKYNLVNAIANGDVPLPN
jgi:hypothetical protein